MSAYPINSLARLESVTRAPRVVLEHTPSKDTVSSVEASVIITHRDASGLGTGCSEVRAHGIVRRVGDTLSWVGQIVHTSRAPDSERLELSISGTSIRVHVGGDPELVCTRTVALRGLEVPAPAVPHILEHRGGVGPEHVVRRWYVYELPAAGALVYVPASTEPAARAILKRTSYDNAPIESWPLLGACVNTRAELARSLLAPNLEPWGDA